MSCPVDSLSQPGFSDICDDAHPIPSTPITWLPLPVARCPFTRFSSIHLLRRPSRANLFLLLSQSFRWRVPHLFIFMRAARPSLPFPVSLLNTTLCFTPPTRPRALPSSHFQSSSQRERDSCYVVLDGWTTPRHHHTMDRL